MSRLSLLQGKSKVFKIGEIEIEFKPLTLEDMSLFAIDENASVQEQAKCTAKLVDRALSIAIPESTPEERQNIGMEYTKEIVNAIMEVNGIKEHKGDPIEKIKARQSQTAIKG